MEFDFPEPQIYLINSILPDRSEIENKFIQLELDFQYTTSSRLAKLLRFLLKVRKLGLTDKFKPTILFIRNEREDCEIIYENSQKLLEKRFNQVRTTWHYWERHFYKYGM